MAQFDELITILKEILNNRFYPKPEYIKGVLGDGLGNVRVPNRADYNYARFNRGAAESFEVFNKTVPEVEDWPVLIGQVPHQPGLIQVVGTDWESYSQSGWGDSVSTANPHAPTHVWRDGFIGADPLSIYMRAIAPGRAYTTSATGTIVYVNSFEYHTGTIWPGTPGVDLQPLMSSLSTGSALFAGVYVDPTTNALGVITGTADVDTAAFDPPLVTFPWGVIPKARVRLYGGQGGLRESDFRDARRVEYVPFTGTVDSDEKVKVSSNDTTPNYLISKMSVDEPLTLVQDNDGGDEDALFGVDLSTLTEETAPADDDLILMQRASDSAFRKVAWSNVGGGGQANLTVKNSSGSTANAGDVGYIDEAGEFRTPSALLASGWVVVVTGGANGANIEVTNRGAVTVNYSGVAPADGDYLVAASANAIAQTYVTPEIFAVCTAAGSGGTVEALLLCNTVFVPATNSNFVFRVDTHSNSQFSALINSAGSGGLTATNVPYDTVTGNEDSINLITSFGAIRLYNSTRGTYRLITAVDVANNKITTVSSTDSWADNDVITVASLTTDSGAATIQFLEIDLSNSTVVPELARAIEMNVGKFDTGAGNIFGAAHTVETFAASKQILVYNPAANGWSYRSMAVPLIAQGFCYRFQASGSATAYDLLSLSGYYLAAP